MGSSDQTPTRLLPLFIAKDKPTWQGDVNRAMRIIDDAFVQVDRQLDEVGGQIERSRAREPFFDIRDFGGAVNLDDNGPAIQKAIDHAESVGGGVVNIPLGRWKVKCGLGVNLLVRSNVTVRGQSRTASVLEVVPDANGDWGYVFRFDESRPAPVAFGLENLTVDANPPGGTAITGSSWGTNGRNIISVHGNDCWVTNCTMNTRGVWAIRLGGYRNVIRGNVVNNDLSNYAFGDYDQSSIMIQGIGARVTDNVLTGVAVSSKAWFPHTAIELGGSNHLVADNTVSGEYHTAVIAADNTWYGYTYLPIERKGAYDVRISRNNFEVINRGVCVWPMNQKDSQGKPEPGAIIRNMTITDNTVTLRPNDVQKYPSGVILHTDSANPGTAQVFNLIVSGNTFRSMSRFVNGSIGGGGGGVKLYAENKVVGVAVQGNVFEGFGDFGVVTYAASWGWPGNNVSYVDVRGNTFLNTRVPVQVGVGTSQVSVIDNTFAQSYQMPNISENMATCVKTQAYGDNTIYGVKILGNTVNNTSAVKSLLPKINLPNGDSHLPPLRKFVTEETGRIQEEHTGIVTVGPDNPARRKDGSVVRSTYGSTIGINSPRTITGVVAGSHITVDNASGIEPGMMIDIPFPPFRSAVGMVTCVVGNNLIFSGNVLDVTSGSIGDAIGKQIDFHTTGLS